MPSIWGPELPDSLASPIVDGDSMLTLAVQADLITYLQEKVKQHGLDVLTRPGRPLLAYAVIP
jgi:hypothetical protein